MIAGYTPREMSHIRPARPAPPAYTETCGRAAALAMVRRTLTGPRARVVSLAVMAKKSLNEAQEQLGIKVVVRVQAREAVQRVCVCQDDLSTWQS